MLKNDTFFAFFINARKIKKLARNIVWFKVKQNLEQMWVGLCVCMDVCGDKFNVYSHAKMFT